MTRRLGRGDAQRGRARLALLVVTLTVTGLILGLSPGGPLTSVMAAVNGTPTATTNETTTPGPVSTPTGPATPIIELINPSAYVTPVVVANKADEDTNYHLVAWVANADAVASPSVQFEITGPENRQLTATRIGSSDTWHAFWAVDVADGTNYNVTAHFFSGITSVDSDVQAVQVRKAQETVEITYPVNAGSLGTFDPIGPANRGFIVDATVSAGATGVRVFYGTSPPGTEQNWRRCSVQETVEFSAPGNRRIGCTVVAGIAPNEITGVAAVVTGTDPFTPVPPGPCSPEEVDPGPPPTCPTVDSGDAHRVTSYEQTPTSVTVSPSSATVAPSSCHVLAATVLDNQSRPIWRANLDVHATGPTDELQFGRVAGRTRDWQPADAAGTHDGTEATNTCGGAAGPPAQAEHNRPTADEKHIETKPADQAQGGTDTSGTFTFALRSPAQGGTAVDAFADLTDNDLKDNEPSGNASITWSAATPTQSASATGSPTTSPSATGSPTGSTSPSATRSPSGTTSPSPTRSPTGTSTTTSPSPAARSITMETSRNTVVFGKTVVFSGLIDSTDPDCEAAEVVNIQQQLIGAAGFTEIGTATSDASGAYAFRYKPAENASYRAQLDPSAECQEATSDTSTVLVRVRVGLNASDNRVPKGSKVRLNVSVKPCGNHAATDVALERNQGRGFDEVKRKSLNAQCKATFKMRMKKDARFRARWPSQDDNHESGVSRTRKVNVFTVGRRNFLI